MQDAANPQQNTCVQIIYVNNSPLKPNVSDYPFHQSLVLGIIQIICGVGCIIIGACSFANAAFLSPSGYGIWGGIIILIAGILAVAASLQKKSCIIAAQLTMSVIGACTALSLFILAAVCAGLEGTTYNRYSSYSSSQDSYNGNSNYNSQTNYNANSYYYKYVPVSVLNGRLTVDSLLAILFFIEGIVALWSSGIGCHFCCCCDCCSLCCCPALSSRRRLEAQQIPTITGQQAIVMSQLQGYPIGVTSHAPFVGNPGGAQATDQGPAPAYSPDSDIEKNKNQYKRLRTPETSPTYDNV